MRVRRTRQGVACESLGWGGGGRGGGGLRLESDVKEVERTAQDKHWNVQNRNIAGRRHDSRRH